MAGAIRDEKRRIGALDEIRREFRAHQSESDEDVIDHLLERATKKMDFIKIVSARRGPSSKGSSRFVMRDGELVEVVSAAGDGSRSASAIQASSFDRSLVTSEHKRRHASLLRRQHFLDR